MPNKRIKIAHSRSLGRRYRGAPYAGRYVTKMRTLLALLFFMSVQAFADTEREIHQFTSNNGVLLGVAYVNYFDRDFFKEFYIKKNGVILFSIKNEKIIGPLGVEAEVSKKSLYGYKVVLAKPTYIVLVMAAPDGHGISDDITIEWDEITKEFHLQKTP